MNDADSIIDSVRTLVGLYDAVEDQPIRRVILTGLHNAAGQLIACIHEVSASLKARQKNRNYGTQTYADVHVGSEYDLYAKSIELKSKTDASTTNVDKEIEKAIKQLQGLAQINRKIVKPRPGDVWVVDVNILNPLACWPFPGANSRPVTTLEAIRDGALQRLTVRIQKAGAGALAGYLSGADIPDRVEGESEDLPYVIDNKPLKDYLSSGNTGIRYGITTYGRLFGGRSSRLLLVEYENDGSAEYPRYDRSSVVDRWRIPTLTIKIRYGAPFYYPIKQLSNSDNALVEMKFQKTNQALVMVGSKTTKI